MEDVIEKRNNAKTMTVQQFSEEFNIGINKAYELIHSKGFPVVFVGKKALILRSRIEEWFEDKLGQKF